MLKKIITIVLIILILIAVGGGIWFLFFKDDTQSESGEQGIGNFFGSLFPFGGSSQDELRDPADLKNQQRTVVELSSGSSQGLRLQQLTAEPIAGAVSLTTSLPDTPEKVLVRYIERATGNTYEVNPVTLERTRLTNTTIPGVREALWHKDGEQILLRYLNQNDVIKSFAGEIVSQDNSTSTELDIQQIDGVFLDDDIAFATISPDGANLLFITPTRNGIEGITAEFDGRNQKPVFSSPHSEWIPQWVEDETFALTTKASAFATGFLYFVDLRSGVFDKIFGDIEGLTTNTNPTVNTVLYSQSSDGRFSTHSFIVDSRTIQKFPVTTLPEKCVWSSERESVVYCGVPVSFENNTYPDVWYQGVVSFSDAIWEIDIERNTSRNLVIPQNIVREEIDIINPFLSDNETFLFFTNKKDSTLWSLEL